MQKQENVNSLTQLKQDSDSCSCSKEMFMVCSSLLITNFILKSHWLFRSESKIPKCFHIIFWGKFVDFKKSSLCPHLLICNPYTWNPTSQGWGERGHMRSSRCSWKQAFHRSVKDCLLCQIAFFKSLCNNISSPACSSRILPHLQHQLGVLQFTSILTPSARKCRQILQGKGSVPQDCPVLHMPILKPGGCYLCFWLTGCKSEVPTIPPCVYLIC